MSCGKHEISTHAPRTGSDCPFLPPNVLAGNFNPRSPHGERRCGNAERVLPRHFNPRSPHGERHPMACLRAEQAHFNPRSPHGERRLPCRVRRCAVSHFNPRSPHGERPHRFCLRSPAVPISTHAPRTGSDQTLLSAVSTSRRFQPTLPARGATRRERQASRIRHYFNPRSPHGERLQVLLFSGLLPYFNPRSPHGERPKRRRRLPCWLAFQPTLPARGATFSSCV